MAHTHTVTFRRNAVLQSATPAILASLPNSSANLEVASSAVLNKRLKQVPQGRIEPCTSLRNVPSGTVGERLGRPRPLPFTRLSGSTSRLRWRMVLCYYPREATQDSPLNMGLPSAAQPNDALPRPEPVRQVKRAARRRRSIHWGCGPSRSRTYALSATGYPPSHTRRQCVRRTHPP